MKLPNAAGTVWEQHFHVLSFPAPRCSSLWWFRAPSSWPRISRRNFYNKQVVFWANKPGFPLHQLRIPSALFDVTECFEAKELFSNHQQKNICISFFLCILLQLFCFSFPPFVFHNTKPCLYFLFGCWLVVFSFAVIFDFHPSFV